jgi:hypothetical protein
VTRGRTIQGKAIRAVLAAALLLSAAPVFVACNDDEETIGEKVDEAGEEIGDEIDDHTRDRD